MNTLLSTDDLDDLIAMKNSGYGSRHIAKLLGISKSSVNNYYKRWAEQQLPHVFQGLLESFEGDTETIAAIEDARNEDRKVAYNRATYGTDYHPDDVAFKHTKKPQLLFYDVETAGDIALTFKRFDANFGQDSILIEGGWLLSVAFAFNDGKIQTFNLTPEEANNQDDSRLVEMLWEAFELADAAVAHNLLKFDLKVFKARCLLNGLPPPKRVKTIDTLRICKQLKLQSNKLDSVAVALGLEGKLRHAGVSMWVDSQQGDPTALEEMRQYNEQDVEVLRNIYHRIKAFDNNHPNTALFTSGDDVACRVCGSHDVRATANQISAGSSLFSEVICNECGARSRLRQSNTSKDKRKSLLA